MILRKLWLIFFFALLTICIRAQVIDIPQGALSDALKHIEASSDYLINYNPEVINHLKSSRTLQIDLQKIDKGLELLFQDHPLDYSISENIILIFPREESTYQVCGYITDKITGLPLELVNLYTSINQGTWTDTEGKFEFQQSIKSDEKIYISYVGYEEIIIPAQSFSSGCLDFALSPAIEDFPMEVIVRDYFLPSITQGESFNGITMDMSATHRDIGAIERDVLKAIQFIPGITSLDETAGNLTIRGSVPDQNLILWEDAPVYNSGHLFGMISSINPFVVDDLKIYKGVYGPHHDNRIGGLLDIRLPDRPATKFQAAVGTTLTEAHGEVTIPLIKDQLSFHLSSRRSTAAILEHNPTLESYGQKLFQSSQVFGENEDEEMEGIENDSPTDLQYADVNAKLIYAPNSKFYLSSSFLNTNNDFDYTFNFGIESPTGKDILNTNSSIWANKFAYQWDENSTTEFRFNLSNYSSIYDFTFNESTQSASSILRSNANDIKDLQIKLNHQFQWKKATIQGGYTYDRKHLTYNISEKSRFENDFVGGADQTGNFHHLFLNSQWHKGKWLFDIGGRATFWDEGEKVILSPRVTVTRSINNHLNFKLSGGYFNQYIKQLQQFNQSSLNIENQLWVLATDNLMTARKLSLGFNYQKNGWLLDFDTYYHKSNGVSVLTSGQSSELNINSSGVSNSSGIELLIKKRVNNWHTALSYHWSEVTFNLSSDSEEEFPSNNDQRHNLTWINYYKKKNWSIGAQYQMRSGLPFTQINDLTLAQDDDDDEEYYEVEIDGLNEQRLPYFHRLDLYLGYQKLLKTQQQINIQLSLLNVFNSKNTTSRSYVLSESTSSSTPQILEVEKFQLGFTPQILLRYSF